MIHDWDDGRALVILRNCRRVLLASGKVLLVERLVPTEGSRPLDVVLSDLNMMVGPGGRERTAEEYGRLLSGAGLTLTRVVHLRTSWHVVEAVGSGAI